VLPLLLRARRVDIVAAFVQRSGLERIAEALEDGAATVGRWFAC
jgi:hypothetical protein